MHRLFVALRPPPAMRAQLLGIMSGVAGARWQSDDQLHLTLRFIGEVDRPQAEDVAAALAVIDQPQPALSLAGVGTFDRKGRPHALWASVAPDAALTVLHGKINRALARAGIPPEHRAYMPHITLGRLGSGSGPVEPFLLRWSGLQSVEMVADSFILFESHLGRQGASYEAIARYPLR